MSTLWDPLRIGDIDLAHRIVMAPLTRNRAGPGEVPTALMARYYAQRGNPQTGAALIISEATQVCPEGQGYAYTPGLHTAQQVAGWQQVTQAVHAQGGRIVAQLWHVGRISHTSLQPGGASPVSSTARAATTKTFISGGFAPCSPPRALLTHEISGIVERYRRSALNAREAGFDGVEIHAANGYLIDQFLRDTINDRTDAYGGDFAGRSRLLVEVLQAVSQAIGAGRTGVRLSPVTPSNDAAPDTQVQALFDHVGAQLAPLRLAYVHVVEGQTGGARDVAPFDYERLRRLCGAPWMVNNGYTAQMALQAVQEGHADMVAFGRPFIANPDLRRRIQEGASWNIVDTKTLYGGGESGYTDYPTLPEVAPRN